MVGLNCLVFSNFLVSKGKSDYACSKKFFDRYGVGIGSLRR